MISRKRFLTGFLALLICSFSISVWAQEDLVRTPAREMILDASNSFIFVFDPEKVSSDQVPAVANDLARRHGASVRFHFTTAIRGFSATLPEQAAARMAAESPRIAYYEKNGVVWLFDRPVSGKKKPSSPGKGGKGGKEPEPVQVVPYGIERVGGPVNVEGQGKTAWVIDTGIDLDHPDLNIGSGINLVWRGKNSANDGHGHGTHVAGTIAALDNAIDVVGVAAGAKVEPIRVLDNSGSGTVDRVVAGVDYVAQQGQAGDCANLSLGASGHFQSLHEAVYNAAENQGILFAVAAGNDSSDANNYEPAHIEHPNVYTVSAVTEIDEFAWFSNWGNPPVDFAAPGMSILSTKKGGGVTTMSGTSMAAPHVCGILLLNGSVNQNGFAVNDPDGQPDPIASR
ncbi:MAG: S8 family serine peptidase [Nitrospinaceae bacterium]